jgi:hypothetical protein
VLRSQARILPEDGLLESHQVGVRIEPQFGAEATSRLADGGQGVRLPSAAVLSERQDRPPSLTPGLLTDQHGPGSHLLVLCGVETRLQQVLSAMADQVLELVPVQVDPITRRR